MDYVGDWVGVFVVEVVGDVDVIFVGVDVIGCVEVDLVEIVDMCFGLGVVCGLCWIVGYV